MKYLLVIDDQKIRKAAFTVADKIIKKIDRLERDLEAFYNEDQRLFSNWFDLTFRDERKQISDRHDEYRLISKFHNWIIAVAKELDTSLPSALILLRKEEAEYAKGPDTVRSKIDETRRKRDQFIQDEIEREFGFDREFGLDDDDLEDEDLPPVTPEDEEDLKVIRQMSDKKIHKICKDRDHAYSILGMILSSARSTEDHALFLRVWELVPHKHQVGFAKEFSKQTGVSLARVISEIREEIASRAAAGSGGRARDGDGDESADGDFDDDFDDDYIGSRTSTQSVRGKKASPAEEESIKLLYRKLVRHLHPDLQTDQNSHGHWQKQVWHRVQTAYRSGERKSLEKLYRLVLIRARSLNELKVSEIVESQSWLTEELEGLNQEAKGLKRLPAWGFSKKKEYATLKEKLAKPLRSELEDINDKIEELQGQHAYFEMIGRSSPGGMRVGRTKRRKRKKTRTAPSRAKASDGKQKSFFD